MTAPATAPSRLKPGDTIGIVAPSSPFDRARFDKGLAWLESRGYRVVVPAGLFAKNGYLAGGDRHRAELINRFFADAAIDAILCARGGYGAMRLLPLLDYETICRHPKILAGFSDVTALLNVIVQRCRLVAFHAPNVTTLGDRDDETRHAFIEVLSGNGVPEMRIAEGRILRPGRASGMVVGGNLTTLCHLIGTPFAPDYKGCILLLEDRGEAPYRIDRMLCQMRLAGCFDGLAGLVLGTFEECGDPDRGLSVFSRTFNHAGIPVMTGLAVGHGMTNRTVPLGLEAVLDTDQKTLSFARAATQS